MALSWGHLEKLDTGMRNRNRSRNSNQNHNGKRNLYKNGNNIS